MITGIVIRNDIEQHIDGLWSALVISSIAAV